MDISHTHTESDSMAEVHANSYEKDETKLLKKKIKLQKQQELDEQILNVVDKFGEGNWSTIAKELNLEVSSRYIRERYINILKNDLKKSCFTEEENFLIMNKLEEIGPKWKEISTFLQGRAENQVKNHFHSFLKKKFFLNYPDQRNNYPKTIKIILKQKFGIKKDLKQLLKQDSIKESQPAKTKSKQIPSATANLAKKVKKECIDSPQSVQSISIKRGGSQQENTQMQQEDQTKGNAKKGIANQKLVQTAEEILTNTSNDQGQSKQNEGSFQLQDMESHFKKCNYKPIIENTSTTKISPITDNNSQSTLNVSMLQNLQKNLTNMLLLQQLAQLQQPYTPIQCNAQYQNPRLFCQQQYEQNVLFNNAILNNLLNRQVLLQSNRLLDH